MIVDTCIYIDGYGCYYLHEMLLKYFYEFREIIILLMESYKTCVLAFDHKSKYLNKGSNYN